MHWSTLFEKTPQTSVIFIVGWWFFTVLSFVANCKHSATVNSFLVNVEALVESVKKVLLACNTALVQCLRFFLFHPVCISFCFLSSVHKFPPCLPPLSYDAAYKKTKEISVSHGEEAFIWESAWWWMRWVYSDNYHILPHTICSTKRYAIFFWKTEWRTKNFCL